ncbi:MAG: hypothetical protein U7126_15150 [Microcoleus sp.]
MSSGCYGHDHPSASRTIAQNIPLSSAFIRVHLRLKYSLTTKRAIAQNTTKTNYLPNTTASVQLAKAGLINSSFSNNGCNPYLQHGNSETRFFAIVPRYSPQIQ